MSQLGYGKDYKYAHAYKGNFVEQQFLPDGATEARFWHPQENASENKLLERMKQLWGGRYGQ
jgi:putative ATPase